MDFPVKDIVEQSIENNVNKLVGTHDVNLNTIVKMAMMEEVENLDKGKVDEVIAAIRKNNELEKYYIDKEYQMTYDNCGNLVYINGETENKNDTSGVVSEPKRCETNS